MTIQSMNLKINDDLASQLRLLNEWIIASRGVIVSSHVNPDGDNIGSQLALGEYLSSIGKKYLILDEDPLPRHYAFLPNSNQVNRYSDTAIVPKEYDLLIVVDSGDLERIGTVVKVIHPEMKVVNLDHHLSNTRFGQLNIVVEGASSIGEMLYYFFSVNGIGITANIASDLYLSIVSDTGFFRYDSTGTGTHLIAADLIERGIMPNYFHTHVNMMKTLGFIKVLGRSLTRLELYEENSIAFSSIFYGDFQEFPDVDTEGMIEHIGTLDTVSVFCLIKEKREKEYRASLRSKYDIDVAKIAGEFGGGGHKRAAGCQSGSLPLEEFKTKLIDSIKREMRLL